MGWGRELWIESLGMKAVPPPPEEQREVKTAIGAARAKQARSEMVTLVSGMGEDLKWATIEICALPLFSLVHL